MSATLVERAKATAKPPSTRDPQQEADLAVAWVKGEVTARGAAVAMGCGEATAVARMAWALRKNGQQGRITVVVRR